jgi:hypothetical protein
MEQISFQYPSWFLILCILSGLTYALVLYYKNDSFRDQSRWLNWLLGSVRFLAITILSVLLLSPLLRSTETESKKPIIVLAQDASESIAIAIDSTQKDDYQQKIESLKEKLEENYEVHDYSFGDNIREGIDFNFNDKVSNLSDMFGSIYDLFSNQNLGAVVLATDGIYNEGSNPIYSGGKLPVPVYAIALGDTTAKRDILLKRVFHNKIAYLGDKFATQVDISARNFSGSSVMLNVYKIENGKANRLQQTPVNINSANFFQTFEIVLDADKSGVQQYRFSLTRLPGEQSRLNNSKDIFIDVLDARQKIMILANSAHPDISALRNSITSNKNYQVEVVYANAPNINVSEYDMLILHQLPSRNNDISGILTTIKNKKIPTLFIVGAQSGLNRLNKAQSIVNIRPGGANLNEVQAQIAQEFSLFTLSEELRQSLPNFAPLQAPFGEYDVLGNGQTVLYQRIGKIDTRYPLLVIGEQNNIRQGVLCAEGIWQWRLFDFLQRENHDIVNELIGKTIQYLSLKEDKRRFRVSLTKNIFNENEPILLDAELYNNNYELVNEPDVSIVITDSDGKNFNYVFTKTSTAYTLNAGVLPTGNYTYTANTNFNGEALAFNGRFSVQAIQLELYETTANHAMLRLLSDEFGGQLVYPDQIGTIAESIVASGKVKPVIYQSIKTKSVIDLKGIFFLVIFLLTLEWFMRRYYGAY